MCNPFSMFSQDVKNFKNQYYSGSYCVPGTILGTGDAVRVLHRLGASPHRAYTVVGETDKQT